MTQPADMASFTAAMRRPAEDQGADLPEAPLAMPEQDLSFPRAAPGWRLMRALQPVRN